MKVLSETSRDRQVTVSGTLDEFAELYEAIKPGGRSSKKANKIRADFAELLRQSDNDLDAIISAQEEEADGGS